MPLNPINVGAAPNDNSGDTLRSAFIKVNDNNTYLDQKAPNAHTHPLSELTQSGATTGQVATWNGAAWAPATPTGGGGSGSVTSVGLSLPAAIFSISNSPVTSSGTLTGSLVNQSANAVFAGPTSGNANPTFRALVASDIPALPYDAAGSVAAHAALTDTAHGMTVYGADFVTAATASAARTKLSLGTAATKNTPATGDASATEAVLGSDTRLTNSRTPTAHAASHASGGSDAITIAQSQVTNLTTDLSNKAALSHTHAWSDIISGKPTTLSGYGITDGVSDSGSYANPSWLTSLAWSKVTSAPTTLSGYGITDALIFKTIAVSGQSSVVADSSTDTLTLAAGTNVTITTDATTDTITISASGGSGGGNVSGPNSGITDNAIVRWDQVNTAIQNSSITISDTGDVASANSLLFATNPSGSTAIGKLLWDTTEKTLSLGIGAGSVSAMVGVDSHILARNTTGSQISKGQVVRVNGASSGNITIALSLGDSDPNTTNTIGVAAEDISNSGTGMVLTHGLLKSYNTQAWTAGDVLYVSPTTAGLLTNVKPTAPNHSVRMGYVVSSNANSGVVYINVNNGYELDELHDVAYPATPASNDFLVYTTNRWENKTPANARTALGLGTAATQASTAFAAASHTHAAADVTSGTFDIARIPTGTTSTTVCIGNDSRLSDSRTPTAHASSHAAAGSDALTLSQSQITNLTTDLSAKAPLASPALTGTPTSTTAAADTNTTQIATTAFVVGQASASTPAALGTAAVGTSLKYARADHVHALPTISLATGVTGTLAIANGGTGQTTATAAFNGLAPGTTKGDLIVHDGTNEVRLAVGATNGHVLTVDSTTATGVKWAAAGGGSGGSTNVWIPAAQWIPRTTNGCGIDSREQATGNINTDELLFDLGAIEFAQAMVVMPSNYDNGTVTARFYWTASSGTASQGVVWAIRGRAFGDNVALGQTYASGGTAILDTYFAANQMHVSDPTAAVTISGTPAANKAVIFEAFRDASNVNDTLAADARFLGVEISYTSV
jgi:hypothetical protein